MPNWKKVVTSGSNAVLNEITSSGGILTHEDIMPNVDNTLSLGSTSRRFQLNGGTPVTVDGSGTANFVTRFQGATTVEDSKIESSDTVTKIRHSNDTNDIFVVSGSNGELLKVVDEIGQQLLQVNDGSGITQFEVSSSGTLVAQNLEYVNQDFVLTYNSASGNITFASSSHVTPVQLYVDTKAASSGYVSWFGVTDIQSVSNRAFSTWIAPSNGYIEKVIVSPEQGNTTTDDGILTMYVGGAPQGSSVTVAMGAAGTHKTFNFGPTSYSFGAGQRISLEWNKNTNTSDIYGMMVIFRLDN